MKRFISIILVFTITLTVFSIGTISAAAEAEGDFEYTQLEDGSVKITLYTGSAADVTIPSTLGGKSVTVIDTGAFSFCSALVSVTLPNSLEKILRLAIYGCQKLQKIHIPAGVKEISETAITDCSSIQEITVDATNAFFTVKDGILFSKDMTRLVLYPKVDNRTSYIVPEGVMAIDKQAITDNKSLTSLSFPTSLEAASFSSMNCPNITEYKVAAGCGVYTSVDGVVFSEDLKILLRCPPLKPGTAYTVPAGTEQLGENCFSTSGLESIILPESLTSVEEYAFYFCQNLKSLKIPGSVKSLKRNFCFFCNNLETVVLDEGVEAIEDNSFYSVPLLKQISIPESLKKIGSSCFLYCDSLKGLIIPAGVTQIGIMAMGYKALDEKNPSFVIYGHGGSAAQTYATENALMFVDIDKPVIYGDCNNDEKVNAHDQLLIKKYLANWDVAINMYTTDCNADGDINAKDMLLLRQYLAHWEVYFGEQK